MVNNYNGLNEYAFISYSHANSEEIEKILTEFQNFSLKFWLDEKIEPGINYSDKIAEKILKSSCFFAFLSNDYFNSEYCCNELQYALRKSIPIICFCLENDIKIPGGFEMQLYQNQVVNISKYKTYAHMVSSIKSGLPKELFGEEGITLCQPTNDTRIYITKDVFANGDLEVIKIVLCNNVKNKQEILCRYGKELFWSLDYSISCNMSPSDKGILFYGSRTEVYHRNYYLSVYSVKEEGENAGISCYEVFEVDISSLIKEHSNKKVYEKDFSANLRLIKRYNSIGTAYFSHETNCGIINAVSNEKIDFKSRFPYEKYPNDIQIKVNYPNGKSEKFIVINELPQLIDDLPTD